MSKAAQPLAGRKIAHLTTVDMSLEYLLLPQLCAARDAGAEVIGISAPGSAVDRLEALGIRHISLDGSTRGMNLLGDLRAVRSLWRILRSERPDVLHTHNPKPGVYGRVIGRVAGVPVVVNTVHGLYASPDDRWLRKAVVYSLEAIASRFSDAELVQNEEDLELMRRLHLAPRARLHLLGNGVDLDRFHPSAVAGETRRRIRAELDVDDATVLFGVVARLVHEKGYRELIEAAERAGPGAAFVAVGGHDPEKADTLACDEIARGEQAGVRFVGHREDVLDLYAAMDVAVLPSYREGLPRSLMEAAAMAKPLIATNIRGCRQVVDDGQNGCLVPPRDAKKLTESIRMLADDRDRRLAYGARSRAIAEERFDERTIVAQVLATYQT